MAFSEHHYLYQPGLKNWFAFGDLTPLPPNGWPEAEKSAYLSGNSTPSANSNWLAEGGWYCKILFDVRAFWISAMAWLGRKAPRTIMHSPSRYCYLIFNHAGPLDYCHLPAVCTVDVDGTSGSMRMSSKYTVPMPVSASVTKINPESGTRR